MNILVPVSKSIMINGEHFHHQHLQYLKNILKDNGNRLLYTINPHDEIAFHWAGMIRSEIKSEITMVSIGKKIAQEWQEKLLTFDANRYVHVWDNNINFLSIEAKAMIIARLCKIKNYDLILLSNYSPTYGHNTIDAYLAKYLNLPLVSNVVSITCKGNELHLMKKIDERYQQRVVADPPIIISLSSFATFPPQIQKREVGEEKLQITSVDLAELGINLRQIKKINSYLEYFGTPKLGPRRKLQNSPSSQLSYDERIEKLIQDAPMLRKNRVLERSVDECVEILMQKILQYQK
ncbi:MAG: hypothetical protein HQK49_09265 [Oligoflexia bacterium]|nr:hypothetical protein [Oligoflexia bacterium]